MSHSCPRGSLFLTEEELEILQKFEILPFLPLARRADGETPVSLEAGAEQEKTSTTLLLLALKGLITLDYDQPLAGFDYAGYEKYPIHGSMALTREGQEALDSLEILGVTE